MPEISNKKRKFIKRNFKQLSIEELAHETGLKQSVIRSLVEQYNVEIRGKDRYSSVKLISDKDSLTKQSIHMIWMVAIVVFLLILIVYTPALKNDFVWDDGEYVYKNFSIRSLNSQSFYWMLTSFHAANWHPLTWLSLAIDYAFWGIDPFGYHLTNIIMHGLNTLLVFFLTIILTVRAKEGNGISSSKMERSILTQTLIVAGVTGLLFGLHPLHVESVAWVAERKDLLCAFFVLSSIISYLSYTSSVIKRHRWIWFNTCLLLFIFALMSKPMAVTLPVTLLLLDIYPLKRIILCPGKTGKKLSILMEKIPFFALSIASSIITIIAQHSWGAIKSFERMPLSFRLVNGLHSLVFYLKKIIWPYKLVPFYPLPKYIYPFDLQYIISGILVLAITGMCLWTVKKGNYLFFTVWSYYLITLLPVLGIIQVGRQVAADRYTYLPSLSIFLLVGIGISWIFKRRVLIKHKVMFGELVLAFICIVILLGQLTIKQIKIWHNSEIFCSYIISVFPKRVPFQYNNLGLAYLKKGELEKAISEYKQALSIKSNYPEAHTNLGNAYFRKGRLDEAIAEHKEALAIKPNLAEAHNNLGLVYVKKGMLDEAISEYKKALDVNPNFVEAHTNLGLVYVKKGMLDEAIPEYKKALDVNPNFVEAHTNLGLVYVKKGMLDEAISEYKKALDVNPNFVEAHNNLGAAYYRKGELDESISEYKRTLAIKPDYADAHNNLSVAYYYKENYKLAIFHCDKAVELGSSVHPKFLELLKPYR